MDRKEYGNKMHVLTDNDGVILCPQCVFERLARRNRELYAKVTMN